jgi:hypothetical protein
MALTLDLNTVMKRDAVAAPASLDVSMSPVEGASLNAQLDFSELVLPPASSFSPDESLARLIASEATTIDLNVESSPMRAIALEFLTSQIDTISQSTAAQQASRFAEAQEIIAQMEQRNALRDMENLWSAMLGTELTASPAVVPQSKQTTETEEQWNSILAA